MVTISAQKPLKIGNGSATAALNAKSVGREPDTAWAQCKIVATEVFERMFAEQTSCRSPGQQPCHKGLQSALENRQSP
jgi:hypothetical protein